MSNLIEIDFSLFSKAQLERKLADWKALKIAVRESTAHNATILKANVYIKAISEALEKFE